MEVAIVANRVGLLSTSKSSGPIYGRRVTLEPIQDHHLSERYLTWLSNPEVTKYLEVRHSKQTFESMRAYVDGVRARPGCEVFAILDIRSREHVGNLSITALNPSEQGVACYGVMIGESAARKLGLGADAVVLGIGWIFGHPKVRKIEVGVLAANIGSWRMLESLGFLREGVQREHGVLADGSKTDCYLYGLLRSEWEAVAPRWLGMFGSKPKSG